MKRLLFLLMGWILSVMLIAQPAKVALENPSLNLTDRFQLMKANSQTYDDYKVIKEYILDGVWKISMDSISVLENRLTIANQNIASLQNDVNIIKANLAAHQQSVEQIQFESEHFSLIGIPFSKGVFRWIFFILTAALVGVIIFLAGHWKLSRVKMKEHMLVADMISKEFDEFKRKALEKQVKLSRELQNERNKLASVKS